MKNKKDKFEELNDRVLSLLENLLEEDKADKIEIKNLITELKNNSIKTSQAKNNNIYNQFVNTHDATVVYKAIDNGKNFEFVDFNSVAEKLEKIKRKDVIGKKVTQVFPAVVEFGLLSVLQKVWRTGEPQNHPISFYSDGRISGWRENSVYKLENDNILVIYKDHTKNKRAEKKSEIYASNLETLINNRNESIWSIDSNYRYIVFNDHFKLQYLKAYKIKLEKGVNALDLLTGDLFHFWKEKYDAALKGERVTFEFSEKIDREIRHFEVFLNPIISKKKITGVSAVSFDITDRKTNEEKLIESEKKYKLISESTMDIIFVVDGKGKILFFNEGGVHLLGYTAKEVIGESFTKFVPLNEVPNYLVQLAHVFKNKEIKNFTTKVIHKKGHLIDVEINGKIVTLNGKLVGQGSIRDISERKLIEKEIKQREENYRGIFNSTSDAIYLQNEEGKFIDVNVGAEKMYGYSRADFIGKTPEFISAPGKNDLNMVMNSVAKAFEGIEQKFEYWGLRKNGEIFPKNVTLNLVIYNGKKVVIAVAKDISEQKKHEEKLKASEEKYKLVAEKASDVVWLMDLKGKSIFVTPSIEKFTGYSIKEYLSQSIEDRFTTDSATKGMKILSKELSKYKNRKIKNDYSKRIELDYRCKDGTVKTGELLVTPFFSENGSLIGIHGVTRDITARVEIEKALKESERNFRLLFENSPLGTYIATPKGEIVDGNTALLKMLGSPSIEATKKINVLDFPPLVSNGYASKFKECVQTNKTLYFSIKYKSKWCSEKFYSSYVIPLSNSKGKVEKVYTIMEDITDKKNSENALIESEKKHKIISNITSDYVFESEVNSKLEVKTKWVAGSFQKITGYSVDEYQETGGWKAHLHPLDVQKDSEALSNLAKNKDVSLEVRTINKNGKVVWLRNVCSPIWDKKNNRLCGIIGACSDITEEKKNQLIQQIQYNIAKEILKVKSMEELFEFVRSELFQFVDVSNFFVALYKEETGELTSTVDYDQEKILTWDVKESITGFVVKSKKQLLVHKKELLKLLKSKKIKAVGKIPEVWLGYPLLSGNKVLGAIVVQSYDNPNAYDDLSVELMGVVASQLSLFIERKKAEEDSLRLSKAIAQSPVSVIITNSEGIIEYVNPQFEKITGYTFEEAFGRDTRLLNSGYHSDEFFEDLWETVISGNDWSGEIYNKKKNGEFFWENVIISPILNDKKEVTHFVAIKEDITEKKKMVAELISSKEKAELSEKIKTEFLAQMSHEIRSPLNTIMSFIELIKEEVSDTLPEEFNYSFQSIESASTRIIRTIDLILNTTDLQLGTYEISVGEINTIDMLKQIKSEYTQSALNKGLDLQLKLEFNRKKIISDEYALIQIISNLVDNAIKYTNKGFVKISASKGDKNELIVKVQDSGIGMSNKFLPTLFNSFTQEEQGYTRKYDGNGLGMALVKNYCNLIATEISVESKKGKGTTFTLVVSNLKPKHK